MNIKECYQRLELPPKATASEIRQAYKKLVKNWHPDRFEIGSPMKAYAEERLKIINAAYDFIRKHPSFVQTDDATEKKNRPGSSPRATASNTDFSPELQTVNIQLLPIAKKVLFAIGSMFHNCNQKHINPVGTKKKHKTGKRFRKPFKRVLKDLDGNRTNDDFSPSKKHGAFRSVSNLRKNYGPRQRKGTGPVAGISSLERKQAINRITPIERVE